MEITEQIIRKNIDSVKDWMKARGHECLYISSYDRFLNEYTPKDENLRLWLTGFTGSSAEVLVFAEGPVHLFIDGRYFEQAASECLDELIQRVECHGTLRQHLEDFLENQAVASLAMIGLRTPCGFAKALQASGYELVSVASSEIESILEKSSGSVSGQVWSALDSADLESCTEKIQRLDLKDGEAIFVGAADSLSWISNLRASVMPFSSCVPGKGLVTKRGCFLYLPADLKKAFSETKSSKALMEDSSDKIQLNFDDEVSWEQWISDKVTEQNLSKVFYRESETSWEDFRLLSADALGLETVSGKALVDFHCLKTVKEVAVMEDNFAKGDRAIYQTIQTIKKRVRENRDTSEFDVYEETSRQYLEQGAFTQSFNTIAGVGPHSSIIHYGASSRETSLNPENFCLLDSGGLFKNGFATDTTRCFWVSSDGSAPPAEFKRIYTLVLKSLLTIQHARFPSGVWGSCLDGITRAPLWVHGMQFQHGVGHGVGINVHEGGVRISPISCEPMRINQVVSLEPGYYVPGMGGVRLENIAQVVPCPDDERFLRFRNLVYVPFEEELIDLGLLDSHQQKLLKSYQNECAKRGRAPQ